MKEFSFRQEPFKVFGVPFFEKTGSLERVPAHVREAVPSLEFLGRRSNGARIGFRTNSKNITVKLVFETLSPDIGMSLYACQSACVFAGGHTDSRYLGMVVPPNYETKVVTKNFEKGDALEDILIFIPRNEILADITISLDDGAELLPPTPYKYPLPILYYGSSITEGGCCSMVSNVYNALISRWLDVDFYNLGFSGSAKGELEMADYINTIEKSIFVMDYDYNAPTVEHLDKTHEPFFKRIREASPELPIILVTRPKYREDADTAARRDVIYRTYQNAIAAGDQNVYFVDGDDFFPLEERVLCSNDICHPNDLGMYYMAKTIAPVIEKILNA